MQDLGPDARGLVVLKPIEVICSRDESGRVRASAQRLGLLTDGEEALDDLQAEIADLKDILDEEPAENIVGYTRRIKDRLDEYIAREA